jgi:hypothetical protein
MKAKKLYGLWCPRIKGIRSSFLYDKASYVQAEAVASWDMSWDYLQDQGYRVIPVTISYEPPPAKPRKRKG